MGNFKIEKVCVTCGADINNVSKELQAIVDEQNHPVEFRFNGVDCVVNTGGDYEKLVNAYHEAIKRKKAES